MNSFKQNRWFSKDELEDEPFQIVQKSARKLMEWREQQIRKAVMLDYDGIDFGEDIDADPFDIQCKCIMWRGTPPKPNKRSIRYTWKWFDNERLKEAIETDDWSEVLQNLRE